ncbi:MAG: 16S rRNA (adenine(1518)-N(6)/adenine(1519)-N(6))-dimethyltransferase RsmA [Candidatus Acidiferrales bacterium]
MARQRLGQHFLGNPAWRQRILETLPLSPGDTWLEIGAGHGEMTQLLAPRVSRVVAIETDARLLPELRERAAREWTNVEIVAGDVLTLDLEAIAGGGPFRAYGNLPYYITSPILHHAFEYAEQLESLHVVIQFEVAERIVATPGHREYGYLSALCQFYARPEIAFRLPPGAFQPPPRVQSALVKMALPGERAFLGISDESGFLKFIQRCFAHKRKTLRNNLLDLAASERVHQVLGAAGLPPDARAEQLTLGQFASLFALFASLFRA